MGVRYIAVSAASTVLSFVFLQFWTELSLDNLKSDGLIAENYIHSENASRVIELLSGSYATIGLLTNFVLNVFVLLVLCLKTIFFVELYPPETRKLLERLVNYVIYKGTFLPLVIPPTIFHAGLWSVWLTVLCSLKMFQALARDRLERLNASPSATPWTYFRIYSVLLLVLSVDLFWIRLCLVIYRMLGSSMFLLLFFEPLSIAFETLQAILVHGFQLLDIWLHSAGNSANCQRFKFLDTSAAGSLWEWKGILIRNVGFSLDMATLLMALGHYVHIWWLHGMAFHLVDAVLFLNIRVNICALLGAMFKRIKGFIKLRKALGALHAALPDATTEELQAYDDECAICREPMAKAKRLHCKHLFHLACLRSWLDQGLSETYSCPTCRKPLFIGRPENEVTSRTGEVLTDEQLARQIGAGLDLLMDEVLYKRGFSQPLLRCLAPDEANYMLREVHEGACGNHSGARSLVHKVIRSGFYWPTIQADAKAYVKVCDQCQRFSNIPRQPAEYLTPMMAPWPFAQWGLDILGPFPTGTRQMKFLVVGIDYFTKWVEAEPLAKITQQNVKNFVWKNIVCRFGVPRVLVSDNGRQFDNTPFREFCEQLGMKNHYSSPSHPQANSQAEVANRSLLKIIKTRLEGAKGIWPDELPGVLWAYRTTARTPTGETPFKLAYGSEAVIPAEVHMTSHRVKKYQTEENDEQLRLNLDLMDEVRMDAEQRTARYKNLMARQYDAMVKPRRFNIGDLVLKRVTLATRNPAYGKLGPNWEGPYRVINCKRQGSYYLEALDGRRLEHPWNVEHLRKYHQ